MLAKKKTWGAMTSWNVWGGLHAATRRGEWCVAMRSA